MTQSKVAFIRIFMAVVFLPLFSSFAQPLVTPAQDNITLEKSVVMIRAVAQEFDYVTPWKQRPMNQGLGSGFIIEGSRILTNAHNVANAKYVEVKKQNLPKRYPAIIMYVGHDCDLALLTVLDKSFFEGAIPLDLGGLPEVNSTVQTYGFPVGGQQVSITEGVVSRVQTGTYSHSQADSHLVIQTDAAINPGNSGGPVVQDGKVVGVAFQGLREADNIGYMIPTTVIRHFLEDVQDRQYDSFGSLGFSFFAGLHNESYVRYLNIPEGIEGIVVLNTLMHSSVEGVLQREDVITKIDDYNIDNDGMIRIDGRFLHMSEIVERKQIGDTVKLVFYRNGQENAADVRIALNRPILDYARQFDQQPRYVVFAGLTFVPVTRNYLEVWGRNWVSDIPPFLRYLFSDSIYLNKDPERKEYIVLSEILPDEVNVYAEGFKDSVIETVNGKKIRTLSDLVEAFQQDTNGFCILEFADSEMPLVLNAEAAKQRHSLILEKYQVPAERNLEGKP
ncbi:MAG: trypsin-like peptidase domain-containing protein [Sedimentisphaerales bacterium]|nr:trypsin-like peptidase domain-containing protein [Sedimentisphaerales bacterium]